MSVAKVLQNQKSWHVEMGDALTVLRSLPDGVVQTCLTSPPFFHLRDYGTGTWEGGDPACEHRVRLNCDERSSTLLGTKSNAGHKLEGFGKQCRRCGAHRVDQQLGLEEQLDCLGWAVPQTPGQWVNLGSPAGTPTCGHCYVCHLVEVFREVRRVLRPDGTFWLNLGDSMRKKQLLGVPWRVAFALQADGWYLRSECVWAKKSCLPESVIDRPVRSHEQVFLFSKEKHYYYDRLAVATAATASGWARQRAQGINTWKYNDTVDRVVATGQQPTASSTFGMPGVANLRDVFWLSSTPLREAHYATMPTTLADICLRATTSQQGCCASCGAPWKRVTAKAGRQNHGGGVHRKKAFAQGQGNGHNSTFHDGTTTTYETVGWQATCTCPIADANAPRPGCLCLDPFAGAGTTGLVARRLQQRFLGIELSQEYAEMSRRRIEQDNPMFNGGV